MSNQRVNQPQTGGFAAVSFVQKMIDQLDSPFRIFYGAILTLIIVYSSLLPDSIVAFTNSLIGRMLSLVVVYLTATHVSWTYGLLAALAILVILRSSSQNQHEGFNGTIVEKPRIGKRWFVEKVLGEQPVRISTEKVITYPVQD